MAVIVCILGSTGEGKTTSTIVNPDGKCFYLPEGDKNRAEVYEGMDPKTHVIINLDEKPLPLPNNLWCEENENYIETADFDTIREFLQYISTQENIKSVSLDTLNLYLSKKEYNDRKKLTYDQWRDVANDIIELNMICSSILRKDQIAYIFGHVELVTDVDGKEKRYMSVIGKKSRRQPPESFYSIVLATRIETDGKGNNKFFFQTRAANSSAKSPIGMFNKFEIPNSLKLVDDTIRAYYKMN